jgi:signal transduction histidine kinase
MSISTPWRVLWLPLAVWAALALASMAAFASYALYDREQTLRQGRHRAQDLADLSAQYSERMLEATRLGTIAVGHSLDNHTREEITPMVWKEVRQWSARLSSQPRFMVIGSNGRLILFSDVFPAPDIDFSDREYYRHHLESEVDDTWIGKPVVGRVSLRRFFTLSRAWRTGSGDFAGVIIADLMPELFSTFFEALNSGQHGFISLYRADGTKLARHPSIDSPVGRIDMEKAFPLAAMGHAAGVELSTSPIDGVSRIVAFRHVPGYRVVAVAGLSLDELLSDWRLNTMRMGAILVTALLAITGLLLVLQRGYRREFMLRADLEKAVEHLSEQNAELERFAYIASHDLRGPLRTIISFTQLLQKQIPPGNSSDTHEYMQFIIGAAHRMHDLIRDIFAFSRLKAGDAAFADVDMNTVCQHAMHNLQFSIDTSGASVDIASLPTVTGHQGQLIELVQNLLSNAIKYARPGEPPRIHISCQPTPGAAVFAVADNGIGIAPSALDIFDIFRRLHTEREYPGTGIGLAICRRIVQGHGGRIWFESQPGQGATFFFSLPG